MPHDTDPAPESLEALLARIGERFEVSFKPLTAGERCLQILDVSDMTRYLDRLLASGKIRDPLRELPVWAKVWPGSFILETWFRKKADTEGKTLLELGCGCAVFSLLAAGLGFASITAGDIAEDALLFAKANVLRNGLEDRVRVVRLDVSKPGADPRFPEGFDFIAASEILYLDELHTPLLNFLKRHLAPGGKAVFCTDTARRKTRFARKAARDFKVQELFLPASFTDAEGERHSRLFSLLNLER